MGEPIDDFRCRRPHHGNGYVMGPDQGADQALVAKIMELQDTDATGPLKHLTDFHWDAVYTYYEGMSAERVNVGQAVFKEGKSLNLNETLAVFTGDGLRAGRAAGRWDDPVRLTRLIPPDS